MNVRKPLNFYCEACGAGPTNLCQGESLFIFDDGSGNNFLYHRGRIAKSQSCGRAHVCGQSGEGACDGLPRITEYSGIQTQMCSLNHSCGQAGTASCNGTPHRNHINGVYPPNESDSRVDTQYIDESLCTRGHCCGDPGAGPCNGTPRESLVDRSIRFHEADLAVKKRQVEEKSLNIEQPPPIPNNSPAIWDLVVADMVERNKEGIKKYGTPLQAGNGRDALVDAYQESLDQTVYLRKEIEERKSDKIHVQLNALLQIQSEIRRIFEIEDEEILVPTLEEKWTNSQAAVQALLEESNRVREERDHYRDLALGRKGNGINSLVPEGQPISYCAIDLTTMRVTEFHKKFNQPILTTPQIPSRDRILLRLSLMTEEFFETVQSCIDGRSNNAFAILKRAKCEIEEVFTKCPLTVNLPDFADGLTDQDIINEGTRLEFGIQREGIESLVHAANMKKEGGGLRDDGKILKPAGWIAPDIDGELRRQGWLG